ncbi:MAG: carbohydrate ABC transporter permease [Clostridia bacterium]|nr:carbohydrate ABC transporter permease [Clostridia bacterium]
MKVQSKSDIILQAVAYIVLILLSLTIIYPFWNLIVISFNSSSDTMRGGLTFYTREFTFDNYAKVFADKRLLGAFNITVLRTVITTFFSTIFTAIFAYGLSRRKLKFRRAYSKFCTVTMYLNAGLIPAYILMRTLHLVNSFWVFVIPSLFSVWNMIIFRTFFDNLSNGLIEAAKIDGAGEYRIFFSIVLPVSKPVVATLALFTAVNQWNAWFDGAIYITDPKLMPLPTLLRQILNTNAASQLMAQMSSTAAEQLGDKMISTRSLSSATMMVSVIPIAAIYPFVQKYFASGVMLGSIKE